jgi:hypothetical protein
MCPLDVQSDPPRLGLPGGGILAMAKETFRQCLRTKVAAVFAILLAGSLAVLPLVMEGDGTLAGRIRTFLDYSTSVTSLLLSLVVVFLSVGLVSADVRDKHAFVVCTKPLARWQYVVGRWLGVVMLAGVLLAGSSAAIYLLSQYLRGRTDLVARPEDRRAVETEIFTARAEILANPPNVDKALIERIRQKKADGSWDQTIEAYKTNYGLPDARVEERLTEDLRKEVMAEAQSVAPGRPTTWMFSNIHPLGRTHQGPGQVVDASAQTGIVAIETDPDLVSRLVVFGPVWLAEPGSEPRLAAPRARQSAGEQPKEASGRVIGTWKGGFRAIFAMEDMKAAPLSGARLGSQVRVSVEPVIQLSYKITPAATKGGAPSLRAAWQMENPTSGFVYQLPPEEVLPDTKGTLIAPLRVVDPNGNLRVRYLNYSNSSVTVLNSDMAVLYEVGSFEANFVKTAALILAGLMFLAAMGVFAGSGLSFPVGCILCFVLLWIATTLRFLTESVSGGLEFGAANELTFIYQFGFWMLSVMKVLLPDLVSTLATSFVVEGLRISWDYFGQTAALTVAVRGAVLLGLACLIFHRRELARVQV